jgi:tRNA-5-taurinomethyluridine 2-sulfurtransferase
MNTAVLLSGGVDSSVALRLLQDQGYSTTAFYLKIWLEDELSFLGTCPWQEDLTYVEAVCKQAGVSLEVISLQKEYWQEVVTQTIEHIKGGLTPNPDILCNQRIKFGAFYSKIDSSFERVATGHYARLERVEDRVVLHTTNDTIKDQTYFLSQVSQKQLSRALFPLGDLTKLQVRARAHAYDLPNKDRKDSQGICFLGKLKFAEFIKYHLGVKEGSLVEIETGKIMGTHQGYWYYTIGQRQGIGLAGGPWYVAAKSADDNTVFISRQYYSEEKIRDTFVATQCNWINEKPDQKKLKVKLRHGPSFHDADIEYLKTGDLRVKLKERDQGIAQGQYAAFYEDTRCLGAGVITYDKD